MVIKLKQKALTPSLREKKRYLVYEVISENLFSCGDLKGVIITEFKELFGLDGLSRAGLEFIEYKDNKGILRVSTKGLDMLRSSLCLVRKINKEDVILRSLGVSG